MCIGIAFGMLGMCFWLTQKGETGGEHYYVKKTGLMDW